MLSATSALKPFASRRSRRVIAAVAVLGLALQAAGEGPASTQPAAFSSAVIISVDDEITDITRDSIERRLKRVGEEKIPLVILELNTPGGALGATLEICDAIKAARDRGTVIYAWVNTQAYSAGTIIALATDGILMARNATIGDSKPIVVSPTGGAAGLPDDIEAKAMSPLLTELRDSARRNGYDMKLLTALVREMQLFWVVNTETGERRFVEAHERDVLFDLPTTTAPSDSKVPRYEPVPDEKSRTPWRYVREAPGLPQVPQPIMTERELLTMRTAEATAYGFSKATIASEEELREHFNISGAIERLELTWIEKAVGWLASPVVRGVLFLLILLGAYAEFQHPGFGFPGVVAAVALVIFLGAPYVAGFTVTWEIVVILLGIGLLAVEIFVLPGFGIPGVVGLAMLGFGLLWSFVPPEPGWRGPHWPTLPYSFTHLKYGLWAMASGAMGSLVGMVLIARYLPRVPLASRLIAPNPTREQVTMDDPYAGAAQIGDLGRAEGPLRPAGKVRFGATLVDVVSEAEYIDKGARVEVIERRGNRVVVRRVD